MKVYVDQKTMSLFFFFNEIWKRYNAFDSVRSCRTPVRPRAHWSALVGAQDFRQLFLPCLEPGAHGTERGGLDTENMSDGIVIIVQVVL